MNKFGLIGYPVEGSLSPKLFAVAYGGKYRYDLLEYSDFETAWRVFLQDRYTAVNITAPFKARAAERCDFTSDYVKRCGAANIAVKTPDGIFADNSDVLALRELLKGSNSVTVIGGGGAGRAAIVAAESLGITPLLLHHDEITCRKIKSDAIVFTLPRAVEGLNNLCCNTLIEANYKTPCCRGTANARHYIGGQEWLKLQAVLGYRIMTGEDPDKTGIMDAI